MGLFSHLPTLLYTLVVLFFLYYLHKIVLYLYHYIRIRCFFPGPKLVNIFGHDIRDLGEDDIRKFENYVQEYPRMYRMIYGHLARVVVACPELVAEIYKHAPDKDPLFLDLVKDWLGNGLVMSSGEIWKRNRRLLTPLFHARHLENFCEVFNKSGENFVQVCAQYIDGDKVFEFTPLARRATFEATINSICSAKSEIQLKFESCDKEKKYLQLLDSLSIALLQRFAKTIYLFDFIYFRSQAGKEYLKLCQDVKDLMGSYIRERKENEKRDCEKREYPDMLDLIMKSRDEQGNGLSDEEMIDELNTFFAAGFDTSTSGLSFFMYCLCKHPEWQDKCREEINSVLGDRSSIEWEDVPKMVCVTNCLKETLRLYGPAIFVQRILRAPLKLDGWTLPEGSMIDISITSVHFNPTVWDDPTRFNPDRFSRENMENKHPYAFIPFSAGARNCIGQHFSLTEMKILICKLLREYEFGLQPGYTMVRETKSITFPKGGLPLTIKAV